MLALLRSGTQGRWLSPAELWPTRPTEGDVLAAIARGLWSQLTDAMVPSDLRPAVQARLALFREYQAGVVARALHHIFRFGDLVAKMVREAARRLRRA